VTRPKALLIVLILWAAIYLPGLGSTELKGEEGRRILPAITMLETGNWLVPYVGGKPFLRKPPLMNWLIALSFKATSVRNEWTARLPSALAVLAMAATIVGLSCSPASQPLERRWMSTETALIAATMAMTSFGLLSKARFAGAEIEGVYAPLFGIAITCWLAWWARGASVWLTWTVPFVFLGIGALAKGPLHVLYFYGIVAAVLWATKRWRALFHPAHLAGILLMSGIFAAWAIPYFQTEATSKASKVWKDQLANRVVENRFEWTSYASNVPRGVGDLLPWVLLAPVLVQGVRRSRAQTVTATVGAAIQHEDESRAIFLPVLIASVGMCLVLLLVPGVLPRYVLPLGIPIALAIAVFLPERQRIWVRNAAVALALASIVYGTIGVRWIARHDDLRPLAAQIDAAVAPGAELIVYDPGYQPALFYVQSPYKYAPFLEDIPTGTKFVLARVKDRKKFADKRPDLTVTHEFEHKGGIELLLLQPARLKEA